MRKLTLMAGPALVVALLGAACGGGGGAAPTATATRAAPPGTATTAPAPTAAPAKGSPKYGGEVAIGSTLDISSLDPHQSQSQVDKNVYFSLYDALVRYGTDLSIIPGLATSWEFPDPKTILFRLRQGVKFHDGTDFNAEAVKWNIQNVQDPKTGSVERGAFTVIESVDAADNYTVKFHLKEPLASLLATLGDRGGMIDSPTAAQAKGLEGIRTSPVGSGPFKFSNWKPGSSSTYERWDGYWDKDKSGSKLPYLNKFTLQVIPEQTVLVANLLTGQIDLLLGVPSKDVAKTKATSNLDVSEVMTTGMGPYIYFNEAKPPLNDVNARRAIAWGIDRQAIINTVYLGLGTPAKGPLSPAFWAYDPTLPAPERNLAKAKEFLKQSSAPNGFTWSLVPYGTTGDYIQVSELIQAQLKDVGITVDIRPMEGAAAGRAYFTARETHSLIAGIGGRVDPDQVIYTWFHSMGGFNAAMEQSGYNRDAELDRLIEQARASYDQAERKRLYRLAQEKITMDAHGVMIRYFPIVAAKAKRVKDFEFYGDGMPRFLRVWVD